MESQVILLKLGAEHCLKTLKTLERHWLCRKSVNLRLREKFLTEYKAALKGNDDKSREVECWERAFERGVKLSRSLRNHRWIRLFKDPSLFEPIDAIQRALDQAITEPKAGQSEQCTDGDSREMDTPRELARRYFDESWYLTVYPDVALAKIDAFNHFYEFGWKEGRNPHAHFDTKYYLEHQTELERLGDNPLEHFVTMGWRAGCSPNRYLDLAKLLQSFPLLKHLPHCPSLIWLEQQRLKPTYLTQPSVISLNACVSKGEMPLVEYGKPESLSSPTRLIAFYEQDIEASRYNGKNWTEILQRPSLCQFHYQPRLPGVLGCYDQRLPETLEAQIGLAKHYGIGAFCFRVSALTSWDEPASPLHFMMQEPERFEFPFMVALQIPSNCLEMSGQSIQLWYQKIHELLPLLRDSRYLRFDGRPAIVLDGAYTIPSFDEILVGWRDIVRQNQLGELFIIGVEEQTLLSVSGRNIDAAIQSPQHQNLVHNRNKQFGLPHDLKNVQAYDYSELFTAARKSRVPYLRFEMVLPGWDESGMGRRSASIILKSDPQFYTNWLFQSAMDAYLNPTNASNWLFVNAWNDWQRSAYLEPDKTFGHAYLEATRNALMAVNQCIETQLKPIAAAPFKFALVSHVSKVGEVQALTEELKAFEVVALWVITTPVETYVQTLLEIQASACRALVIPVKNCAGSTRAFYFSLDYLKKAKIEFALRLSTPKIPRDRLDAFWRKALLEKLLGRSEAEWSMLHALEQNPSLGWVGATVEPLTPTVNEERKMPGRGEGLWDSLKLDAPSIGSVPDFVPQMFWFRRAALDGIATWVSLDKFEELTDPEGFTESMELLMPYWAMNRGYEFQVI